MGFNQIIFNWAVFAWLITLSLSTVQHRDAIISEIDVTTRILEIIKDYHYDGDLDNDNQ